MPSTAACGFGHVMSALVAKYGVIGSGHASRVFPVALAASAFSRSLSRLLQVNSAVVVDGLSLDSNTPGSPTVAILYEHIADLEEQLAQYRRDSESSCSLPSDISGAKDSSYDMLEISFEQLNLGLGDGQLGATAAVSDIAGQTPQSTTKLDLPSRETSSTIVQFAMTYLGWIHCALRADVFVAEHCRFWDALEADPGLLALDTPFAAVYFAVLSVGAYYIDPQYTQSHARLNPMMYRADALLSASRHWYRASLRVLERTDFLGKPRLETLQVFAILTLPDPDGFHAKAREAAEIIAREKHRNVPPLFNKSWIVQASTVAAGVFMCLDLLFFSTGEDIDHLRHRRNCVEKCITALQSIGRGSVISKRGPMILRSLLDFESRLDHRSVPDEQPLREIIFHVSQLVSSASALEAKIDDSSWDPSSTPFSNQQPFHDVNQTDIALGQDMDLQVDHPFSGTHGLTGAPSADPISASYHSEQNTGLPAQAVLGVEESFWGDPFGYIVARTVEEDDISGSNGVSELESFDNPFEFTERMYFKDVQ
ncbi:aurofusarin cluster transcription factor aurR2 [Colletotrichum asianum]|uniref:Aurofusarin cluster transcription factor aurR2 n=1 Tax=Colletotrichum asianum TaxID=702518 RepID=A0A8H3W9J7_9PEZI|nr:aurofusarin cluster transcription factor aurR2 [Colletotrichum asianum]